MSISKLGLHLAGCLALMLQVSTALAASPFAGDWSGPWHDQNGQSGVFSLHIDQTGGVDGDVTNGGMTGKVWGRISDAGDLDAHYRYEVVSYRATAHLILRDNHLGGTAHYEMPLGVPLGSGPVDLTRIHGASAAATSRP